MPHRYREAHLHIRKISYRGYCDQHDVGSQESFISRGWWARVRCRKGGRNSLEDESGFGMTDGVKDETYRMSSDAIFRGNETKTLLSKVSHVSKMAI